MLGGGEIRSFPLPHASLLLSSPPTIAYLSGRPSLRVGWKR